MFSSLKSSVRGGSASDGKVYNQLFFHSPLLFKEGLGEVQSEETQHEFVQPIVQANQLTNTRTSKIPQSIPHFSLQQNKRIKYPLDLFPISCILSPTWARRIMVVLGSPTQPFAKGGAILVAHGIDALCSIPIY